MLVKMLLEPTRLQKCPMPLFPSSLPLLISSLPVLGTMHWSSLSPIHSSLVVFISLKQSNLQAIVLRETVCP